ncbi:MAG TPA: alpha/beta fold hydrolase [Burkholderiaceae bacterium]|nr:alpha/beta fold hydrolase [Burkholderiaceae bacterium]
MLRLLTRPLALLAVALGLGGAFAGCASLDEWQRQAIFNPARDNPRWFSEPITGTEEYDLTLPNGHRVHAWHIAQPKGAADAPTVLYLHGARWNMNGSVFRIARWHELGFNVLAVDYRGFGKSTDLLPSEETAVDDARLAFEELKRRQPDASRRYLYGHSLGGALAIDLAARELQADPNAVAGVIIESTFTSIPDVVRGMKWGWVPGIGLAVTQPFDTVTKIGDVRAPLLVLHGTSDSVVPHTMADTLYAAAGSREKTLVKIEGGTHSGSSRTGGSVYREAVLDFVRRTGSTTTADAQ